MKLGILLIFASILYSAECLDCYDRESSQISLKLLKKILCDYDKYSSPGDDGPVEIKFDYTLMKFDFYAESRKILAKSWTSLRWIDKRLTWNPVDYENLNVSSARFKDLWVPDITLASESMDDLNSCTNYECEINPGGLVNCPMICEHDAYCNEASSTNWPYGYATCELSFMSMKSLKHVYIYGSSFNVNLNDQGPSQGWELMQYIGEIQNVTNDMKISNEDPNALHSCVKLKFIMKKYSDELVHQVMIPAVIIIIINISLLLLDCDLSVRWILYAINIFNHQIYQEQLIYMLPKNGEVTPKILVFFCDSNILTILLMFESIIFKCCITSAENSSILVKNFMDFLNRAFVGQVIIKQDRKLQENGNFEFENERKMWKDFSCFVDRILIPVMIVVYSLMFFVFSPADENDNLSGYYDTLSDNTTIDSNY